jgi:hypothetical protein
VATASVQWPFRSKNTVSPLLVVRMLAAWNE